MKVIKVYGALRKRLGQCRFEFDVATPAQAIKALCVNFDGLEKWLLDSERDGIGYRLTVSKEKVTHDNFAPALLPFSDQEVLSITPVIAGAANGGNNILIGATLIALAVVTYGGSLAVSGLGVTAKAGLTGFAATGAAVAASAATVGAGLIILGVAQIISPQPEPNELEEAAQLESFTISNVINTSRQGLPVPIAYGRLFVGSAVLSSGLDVDQLQA